MNGVGGHHRGWWHGLPGSMSPWMWKVMASRISLTHAASVAAAATTPGRSGHQAP